VKLSRHERVLAAEPEPGRGTRAVGPRLERVDGRRGRREPPRARRLRCTGDEIQRHETAVQGFEVVVVTRSRVRARQKLPFFLKGSPSFHFSRSPPRTRCRSSSRGRPRSIFRARYRERVVVLPQRVALVPFSAFATENGWPSFLFLRSLPRTGRPRSIFRVRHRERVALVPFSAFVTENGSPSFHFRRSLPRTGRPRSIFGARYRERVALLPRRVVVGPSRAFLGSRARSSEPGRARTIHRRRRDALRFCKLKEAKKQVPSRVFLRRLGARSGEEQEPPR
jgi:hypothetical protein